MKYLILLTLIFASTVTFSKDLPDKIKLDNGLTINVGDSLLILPNPSHKVLSVIQPANAFYPGIAGNHERKILESIFIGTFMVGNTYEVQKVYNKRVSKKPDVYKNYALISDKYADTDPDVKVWIVVELDKGFNIGVLKHVKTDI